MSKVITLSRYFQKGHPRAGHPTFFVEKIWKSLDVKKENTGVYRAVNFKDGKEIRSINKGSIYDKLCDLIHYSLDLDTGFLQPKHHTIREVKNDKKRWKTGDMASLRVWSGKPYRSPQITIAPDVQLTVKDIEIHKLWKVWIDGVKLDPVQIGFLAQNDGLTYVDMVGWFSKSSPFSGQILIWNNNN